MNPEPNHEAMSYVRDHIADGLFFYIMQAVALEANRLNFDLARLDGGLSDGLLVARQLDRVATRARTRYLWANETEEEIDRLVEGFTEDGYADRFGQDLRMAWMCWIGQQNRENETGEQGGPGETPASWRTVCGAVAVVVVTTLIVGYGLLGMPLWLVLSVALVSAVLGGGFSLLRSTTRS